VKFTQPFASYNAGDVAYFTPATANALKAAGHTALDAIPAGTAAPVTGHALKHQVRVARESEPISSEADRQLVAAEAALQ
jgi:hypothetical protein